MPLDSLLFFDITESGPVGSVNVVRVSSSMLRVEWTEPVNFNGVFQTYTVLVSVKEGSNAKHYNTTGLQWTVSGLGKFPSH